MVRLIVCTVCAGSFLMANPAGAATLYKCSGAGKVSYGDQPCTGAGAGVKSIEMHVTSAPPPDPHALAELARQHRLLAKMQTERRKNDAQDARERARYNQVASVRHVRCAKLRLKTKTMNDNAARSAGFDKEMLHRKAGQQREAMAIECPA